MSGTSKAGKKIGEKVRGKYIDILDSVSRRRYESKLSAVNVDPYQNTEWSEDVARLPSVEQADISDYLVHRTSYYTQENFKAERALGAHNQLTSGWVKKILTHKPRGCGNTITIAQVDHSQCLSDKALKPWAIVEPDGTVVTAHCDCMAGIGETCTHIAALLFAVDASVRLRDSWTPTMLPASWVIPSSTSRDAMYTECSKIDFTSSSTRKRKFDATLDGTTVKENSKRKTNNVTVPTRKDIEAFFDSIQSSKTGVMPAVLSLVPKYAAEYKAAVSQQNKLPAFLGALEDEACQHTHFQDLLEHCESVNICVSKGEAAYGEQQTKGQAKCKTWDTFKNWPSDSI